MDARLFSRVSRRWRVVMVFFLLLGTLLASCGERGTGKLTTPGQSGTPGVPSETPIPMPQTSTSTAASLGTPSTLLPLGETNPRFAALKTTRSIAISERYGMSGTAFISDVKYLLARSGDDFVGNGTFVVPGCSGSGGAKPEVTVNFTRGVILPLAATTTFLQRLAAIPLQQSSSSPSSKSASWEHELRIVLETDMGRVEFRINAATPTAPLTTISASGFSWTSVSGQSFEAIRTIEPYLQRALQLEDLEGSCRAIVPGSYWAEPTPVPTVICSTASPAPAVLASAIAGTPIPSTVSPAALVRIGDVIDLATFFGLPRPPTGQISVSPDSFYGLSSGGEYSVNPKTDYKESDLIIYDPRYINALNAALGRPATVVAAPSISTEQGVISLLVDLRGKNLSLRYFPQSESIAFSTNGQTYAIAAPREFREVLTAQLCTR